MSYYFGDDVRELVNSVSAYDALIACGAEMKKAGSRFLIYCPNPTHHDTHLGSCVVMPNKQGRCHCYACNKEFNSLDIMIMAGGYNWYDAMMEIARLAGRLDEYEQNGKPRKKEKRMRPLTAVEKQMIGLSPPNRTKLFFNMSFEKPEDADWIWDDNDEVYEVYRYAGGNMLDAFAKENPVGFARMVQRKSAERLAVLLDLWNRMNAPVERGDIMLTCVLHRTGIEKEDLLKGIEDVCENVLALYHLYGGRDSILNYYIRQSLMTKQDRRRAG